jgi:hypothetical protein
VPAAAGKQVGQACTASMGQHMCRDTWVSTIDGVGILCLVLAAARAPAAGQAGRQASRPVAATCL